MKHNFETISAEYNFDKTPRRLSHTRDSSFLALVSTHVVVGLEHMSTQHPTDHHMDLGNEGRPRWPSIQSMPVIATCLVNTTQSDACVRSSQFTNTNTNSNLCQRIYEEGKFRRTRSLETCWRTKSKTTLFYCCCLEQSCSLGSPPSPDCSTDQCLRRG